MSWVEQAAPIVHEVIRRVGRSDLKALRREFRKAYPFGRRTNAPYKAWLSEIDVSITAVERMERCQNVTPWSTGRSACRR